MVWIIQEGTTLYVSYIFVRNGVYGLTKRENNENFFTRGNMPDKGYHFIVRGQMVIAGSGIAFRKRDYALHRDSEINW